MVLFFLVASSEWVISQAKILWAEWTIFVYIIFNTLIGHNLCELLVLPLDIACRENNTLCNSNNLKIVIQN